MSKPRKIELTPGQVRALAPVFREAEKIMGTVSLGPNSWGVLAQVWLEWKPARRAYLRARVHSNEEWTAIQAVAHLAGKVAKP